MSALSQPHAVCAGLSRETQEMVFDAHERAFQLFGGAASAASTTT